MWKNILCGALLLMSVGCASPPPRASDTAVLRSDPRSPAAYVLELEIHYEDQFNPHTFSVDSWIMVERIYFTRIKDEVECEKVSRHRKHWESVTTSECKGTIKFWGDWATVNIQVRSYDNETRGYRFLPYRHNGDYLVKHTRIS